MPRDLRKEYEWARGRYAQVKFTVSKELAEEFRRQLGAAGLSAVEWFRGAVEAGRPGAAPHADAGAGAEAGADARPRARKRKRRLPAPAPDAVARWAALRAQGWPFARIAEESGGYDVSTVRKRVIVHGGGKGTEAKGP